MKRSTCRVLLRAGGQIACRVADMEWRLRGLSRISTRLGDCGPCVKRIAREILISSAQWPLRPMLLVHSSRPRRWRRIDRASGHGSGIWVVWCRYRLPHGGGGGVALLGNEPPARSLISVLMMGVHRVGRDHPTIDNSFFANAFWTAVIRGILRSRHRWSTRKSAKALFLQTAESPSYLGITS